MDGVIANLSGICDLAERRNAMVMVDDSHATGFIYPVAPPSVAAPRAGMSSRSSS